VKNKASKRAISKAATKRPSREDVNQAALRVVPTLTSGK
jgi:hypothetical protein